MKGDGGESRIERRCPFACKLWFRKISKIINKQQNQSQQKLFTRSIFCVIFNGAECGRRPAYTGTRNVIFSCSHKSDLLNGVLNMTSISQDIFAIAERHARELDKKVSERMDEMQCDDLSHHLIYRVLGVDENEGR